MSIRVPERRLKLLALPSTEVAGLFSPAPARQKTEEVNGLRFIHGLSVLRSAPTARSKKSGLCEEARRGIKMARSPSAMTRGRGVTETAGGLLSFFVAHPRRCVDRARARGPNRPILLGRSSVRGLQSLSRTFGFLGSGSGRNFGGHFSLGRSGLGRGFLDHRTAATGLDNSSTAGGGLAANGLTHRSGNLTAAVRRHTRATTTVAGTLASQQATLTARTAQPQSTSPAQPRLIPWQALRCFNIPKQPPWARATPAQPWRPALAWLSLPITAIPRTAKKQCDPKQRRPIHNLGLHKRATVHRPAAEPSHSHRPRRPRAGGATTSRMLQETANLPSSGKSSGYEEYIAFKD